MTDLDIIYRWDGGKQVMTVGVSVVEQQIAQIQQELSDMPNAVQRICTRSINKVGTAARAQIVRTVCEQVNLRPSDVSGRNVSLTKANYDTMMAMIIISGRRVPLLKWAARQVRRGVSYAIRRGGRTVLEHAFIATMPSGHVGVMIRTGPPEMGHNIRRRRGPGQGMAGLVRPRLPIEERFGPSVPEVVKYLPEFAQGVLEQKLGENLQQEVSTQIGLAIQRRGGFQND